MKQGGLTYELLCAAVHGNSEAQERILAIYDPYIRKLSRIIIQTADGELYRVLDEDLYIIVDDTVLARNAAVEERLNIELAYHHDDTAKWDTIAGILNKYLMAGDTTFDLYTGQQYGITTLMTSGGL